MFSKASFVIKYTIFFLSTYIYGDKNFRDEYVLNHFSLFFSNHLKYPPESPSCKMFIGFFVLLSLIGAGHNINIPYYTPSTYISFAGKILSTNKYMLDIVSW